MVKTYDPKKVLIACGTHSVTGLADDAFCERGTRRRGRNEEGWL